MPSATTLRSPVAGPDADPRHRSQASRREHDTRPIRILVADQAPVIVDGVTFRLRRASDFVLLGSTDSVNGVLQHFDAAPPDVIFLEHALPGGGVEAVLANDRVRQTDCKIVVFSSISHRSTVRAVLQAGAHAYILRTDPLDDLPQILRTVHAGHHYVSPALSSGILSDLLDPASQSVELTTRQREILRLIAHGRTSPEIAQELGIQLRTVHTHRARLMKKLQVHTATALVHRAQQEGLL